jgi:hypothetical protein
MHQEVDIAVSGFSPARHRAEYPDAVRAEERAPGRNQLNPPM